MLKIQRGELNSKNTKKKLTRIKNVARRKRKALVQYISNVETAVEVVMVAMEIIVMVVVSALLRS